MITKSITGDFSILQTTGPASEGGKNHKLSDNDVTYFCQKDKVCTCLCYIIATPFVIPHRLLISHKPISYKWEQWKKANEMDITGRSCD